MPATKQDISQWFGRAVELDSTHMLVVCDTYEWEDYPVYVSSDEDINAAISQYSENLQKVMEMYNCNLPRQPQLDKPRTWNV